MSTATTAKTLREHLQQKEPEVWDLISTSGFAAETLISAAVWDWPRERLTTRRFCIGEKFQGDLLLAIGLALGDDSGELPPDAIEAWQGVEPEHMVSETYVNLCGGAYLGARLNAVVYQWTGRRYEPQHTRERAAHGRALIEVAAQKGEVRSIRETLETYGTDESSSCYANAAKLAANGGHVEFLRELIGQVGPEPTQNVMDSWVLRDGTPRERVAVLTLLAAGVTPTRGGYIAQLIGEELADRAGSQAEKTPIPPVLMLELMQTATQEDQSLKPIAQRLGEMLGQCKTWPADSRESDRALLGCLLASGWPVPKERVAVATLAMGQLLAAQGPTKNPAEQRRG